jgi:hypothetical protein
VLPPPFCLGVKPKKRADPEQYQAEVEGWQPTPAQDNEDHSEEPTAIAMISHRVISFEVCST